MEYPTAKMKTSKGGLKSPPYTSEGQKKTDFLKPPHMADLLDKQYLPSEALSQENLKCLGNNKSDRVLEKLLDKYMSLSGKAKIQCESARMRGDKVYTKTFGAEGNTIEVFFSIDTQDANNPKKKTSTHKSLEETEMLGSAFTGINLPSGGIYVALDNNFRRIFVYFNKGLEIVYGPTIGQWVLDATTYNFEEYAEIQPPSVSKDQRHGTYENWLLSNPHLCWAPWSRAGVYQWGSWMEQGHDFKGSCITKDISSVSAHIKPVLAKLFRTLGNTTRANRLLLGAVDEEIRDLCEKIITDYPKDKKNFWITDDKECFALRACLINVLTEPHYDGSDLDDGWASMMPMGEYRGGDLCITELERRFSYQPGGIGFIRGNKLEHYTLCWHGIRFSLVSTMHESIRREHNCVACEEK